MTMGYIHLYKTTRTSKLILGDIPDYNIEKDFVGCTLLCTYTGFGVQNMSALITLRDKSEAIYSGGIESYTPGFWRIFQTNNITTIEITQPLLP